MNLFSRKSMISCSSSVPPTSFRPLGIDSFESFRITVEEEGRRRGRGREGKEGRMKGEEIPLR